MSKEYITLHPLALEKINIVKSTKQVGEEYE